MQKQVHVVNQEVVKRRRLNYLSVVGNMTLKIYMRKHWKALVKRKILEYVSVGEKVELIKSMRKLRDGNPYFKNKNILLKEQIRKKRIF